MVAKIRCIQIILTCDGINGMSRRGDLVDAAHVVPHVLVVLEELVANVARHGLLLQLQLLQKLMSFTFCNLVQTTVVSSALTLAFKQVSSKFK